MPLQFVTLYNISFLVGKPQGKGPLEGPRRKWANSSKMDLRDIEWDGTDLIQLAQDRGQFRCP
jgi:hypothetical protein